MSSCGRPRLGNAQRLNRVAVRRAASSTVSALSAVASRDVGVAPFSWSWAVDSQVATVYESRPAAPNMVSICGICGYGRPVAGSN